MRNENAEPKKPTTEHGTPCICEENPKNEQVTEKKRQEKTKMMKMNIEKREICRANCLSGVKPTKHVAITPRAMKTNVPIAMTP